MKFTESIKIDRSAKMVAELFTNPNHLDKWMDGFQSMEHLSGKPGTQGAKSRLLFKTGKRKMEMVETINSIDLPNEFIVDYDTGSVYNNVKNTFKKLSDNQTELIVDTEYKFKGFMKLMAPFMSGVFKKQVRKYLKNFKSFVENE